MYWASKLKSNLSGRRATRDRLMKYLYTMDMTSQYTRQGIEDFVSALESAKESDYANRLLDGFLEHKDEIDGLIETSATGWKLSRMNKVDLAILRLATTELLRLTDIPTEVSINEAMELAKVYSGDDAHSFINGVLGHVASVARSQ